MVEADQLIRWIVELSWQLAGQAPVLLAYLIGAVLAWVYWNRCPTASMLTLTATTLLLITSVGSRIVFQYLVHVQSQRGGGSIRQDLALASLASSCVYAVAIGMLLAAVFVGRKDPTVGRE